MTEGDRPSTANSRHDYTQRCWLAQKIFRVHSRTRARACCSTAVPTTVLRSSEMTFGLATPNFHRSFTRFLPLFEQPALLYSTNFPLKFNRVISHTSSKRTLSDSTREIIFSPPFFPPNLDSARLRVRSIVHFFTVSLLYTHREKNQLGRDKLLLLLLLPLSMQATMNACTNASRLHLRVAFPPSSYVAARWYARVT